MLNIVMYHYVRNNEEYEYDVHGRRKEEFTSQIEYFNKNFKIINPNDKNEINYYLINNKDNGFLLTFDDGYKDHIFCSDFLNSLNLSGIFFPPINAISGDLLDVNGIHFLIGQRNINSAKVISFIIDKIKEQNLVVKKNNCIISIEEYLKSKFDSRFDSKEILLIKRLLQRDISGLSNRKKLLKNLIKQFTNYETSLISKNLYLNKKELMNMKNKGMYFGSHGLKHQWLNTLNYEEQYSEINESFKKLEELRIIDSSSLKIMCYPYGAYNQFTIKINKELKIDYALTTKVGSASINKNITKYELSRWDTNDFWDLKWKRPKVKFF